MTLPRSSRRSAWRRLFWSVAPPGPRLSLVTALRHPDVASKLVVWWMSGGVFGTMCPFAMNYILPVIAAALVGGMPAVVELPQWDDTLTANPSNRDQLLAMDTQEFIDIQKRWLNAYIPMPDAPVPGIKEEELAALKLPALIFRSGKEDEYHPELLSLELHRLIPGSELIDPPWGDDEWNRVKRLSVAGKGSFFDEWPRLAPPILDFLSR